MNELIAVTYDVCEVENLYESMIEHTISDTNNLDEEVAAIAARDIAPVVKVFNQNRQLVKEYTFSQYECNCSELD
ncbi:hypothetical protein ACTWQB_00940 [Piscibacillus sp. B03]|uniref:hypothetical protein n=1 Tax=Piscibacillus sp. B03 TaxID=3457430 RepID=UPI003FCD6906